MQIRHLKPADWADLVNIYNHYILNSHCTFDIEPFDVDSRTPWLQQFEPDSTFQCLVAVEKIGVDEVLLGYACSTRFKERPAYNSSVEVSVYVAHTCQHRGVGKSLYRSLFDKLTKHDLHRAYAGICLPNDASVALHEHFGFKQVGRFGEVGFKFGQYWDVAWLEKPLS